MACECGVVILGTDTSEVGQSELLQSLQSIRCITYKKCPKSPHSTLPSFSSLKITL